MLQVFIINESVLAKQMCELFPKERIRFYACGGSGTFRNVLKGIPEKEVGLDVRKFEDAVKFKIALMIRDSLKHRMKE